MVLNQYQSYDEMAIAAHLVVSVPTHFINDGEKTNFGKADGELRHLL